MESSPGGASRTRSRGALPTGASSTAVPTTSRARAGSRGCSAETRRGLRSRLTGVCGAATRGQGGASGRGDPTARSGGRPDWSPTRTGRAGPGRDQRRCPTSSSVNTRCRAAVADPVLLCRKLFAGRTSPNAPPSLSISSARHKNACAICLSGTRMPRRWRNSSAPGERELSHGGFPTTRSNVRARIGWLSKKSDAIRFSDTSLGSREVRWALSGSTPSSRARLSPNAADTDSRGILVHTED